MTLLKKKGIAVLKGVDVVHKLTGDGTAIVGKTGSTVTLSGTIATETSFGDVKSLLEGRGSEITSLAITADNIFNTEDAQTTSIIDGAMAGWNNITVAGEESSMTSAAAEIDADTSVAVSLLADFEAARNSVAVSLEANFDAMKDDYTAKKGNIDAKNADFAARLVALKNAGANFDTIAEVEALILAASGSQDGDLINKMGTLATEIGDMEAARLANDGGVNNAINTQISNRISAIDSLQTLVIAEETNNTNKYNATDASWQASYASLATRMSDADDLLEASIQDEEKARIEADSALSTRISAAMATLGSATGSFNTAVAAEEAAEDLARSNDVSEINTAITVSGRTNDLRGLATDAGSVAAEESTRVSLYASLATKVTGDYSTAESIADVAHASIQSDKNAESGARITKGISLSGVIDDFTTAANGHVSELQGFIVAEEGAEDSAVTATEALVSAQRQRLDNLTGSDATLDSFVELVSLVNAMSGSDATALSNETATVLASIAALTNNRTTGDQDEVDYLNNTVINGAGGRVADIATMQSILDDAEATFTTMETAHTNFLAAEKTSLSTQISTWEAGALSLAESTMTSARIAGDQLLQSNLATQTSDRQAAVAAEAKTQQDEDQALSARIDALEVHWEGGDLTLTGHLSIGGNLAVSGEVKMGVHTSVPAGYASGDQSGNNGAMFYLDAADDATRTDFEKGYSWYFCEDGVWFASPFDNE